MKEHYADDAALRDEDFAALVHHYAGRLNDAVERAEAAGLTVSLEVWVDGDDDVESVEAKVSRVVEVTPRGCSGGGVQSNRQSNHEPA